MSDAVWVPVNAEMKGFVSTLVKEASGAGRQGSQILEKEFAEGGKRAGQAAADGLASQARKIEQISTKLGTARKAEAQAASDVTVAEQRLQSLRDSGSASASQLAKAEQQLETAKMKQGDAAARIAREEQNLDAVRSGAQAQATTLSRAEDSLATARTSQQTSLMKVRTAELQVDEARSKAKSAADSVQAAETNLINVRDRYGANTKQTAQAERELERAKKQAETANRGVATAEGAVRVARSESASATDILKAKELTYKAVQEDVTRSVRDADRAHKSMGQTLTESAGKVGNLAQKYSVHAGVAMGAIGLLARESVMYASEAEQSYGAVESVFGDHAQGIIDASKGAADAVGLSGREYRELSSVTGAMLANMGMPMDEVAAKSQNLVGIAADLAATFGGSTKDAIEAVNALMRGEADPIERYGVSIKEADISARLAAQGLDKLEGSAGKQARAQAMLGLLMEQTSKAQGQFGRETDTAAHKQQVATAKLNDAKEVIGTGLLPALAELADIGARVAGVIGEHPKAFIALGAAITGLLGTIMLLGAVAPIFMALSAAAGAAEMSMWGFVAAQAAAAAPFMLIAAAATAVGVALWAFFTKTETGRQMWDSLVAAFQSGLAWIQSAFVAGWDMLVAGVDRAKDGFQSLRDGWNQIPDAFRSGIDTVRSWWDGLVNGFSDGVSKVTGFFSNIRAAWGELTAAFRTGDDGYGGLAALIGSDKAEWAVNALGSVKYAWEELKLAFQGGDWGYGALAQIVGVDQAQFIVNAVAQVGAALTMMKDAALLAVAPIRDLFTTVFAQWQATITAGWQIVQTIFGLGWEILKQVAAAAWLVLVSIFTGNFAQIGVIVSNAWTNITMFTSMAFTNILAIAQGWVDGTLARISFLWQQAQFYFQAGAAFVQNAWGMMVDWVIAKATEWAMSVAERAVQLYVDVTSWIDQLPGRVEGAFMSLVAAALGQVQAWYNNTTTTVINMVNEVINYVNELPGRIGSIFANAGEWLVNAGKNILNGLWNGMKSAWSSVEGWLDGIQQKVSRVFSRITSSAQSVNSVATHNANGSFVAYVDGGIQQLEAYANGGGHLPNQPVIERPHGVTGLVQWAEASTGGELFAPVNQLKARTPRAMAIMAAGAEMAGATLVDKQTGQPLGTNYGGDLGPQAGMAFAEGGVTGDDLYNFVNGASVNGHQARRSLEGAPYDWAGINWGDCSGTQSAIARFATGQDPFGGRFATGNEADALSSMGFERGRGGEGDLRIGFLNGGPAGGHTAGTLPDGTNVEMGGGRGNGQIGGAAAGAWDSYFDTFFYLPIVPPIQIDTSMTAMDPVQINAMRASGIGRTSTMPMATATTAGEQTIDPRLAAPASREQATAYGVEVAKSVFADEMGSKSVLQLGADAVFDFFGMGDSLTKKLVTTPLDELMPVPDWYGKTSANTGSTPVGADGARTSVAEDHAVALHDTAVTTMTPSQLKADPQLRNLTELDVVEMPKGPSTDWGEEFFAYEIARAAQTRGLPLEGAMIGEAVALVESGDPMQMWANNAVPGSLAFRHDAVGSDYDSVGLFQQRDNGAWGTLEQRMDPYESAGLFFDAMLSKFPDWAGMDPGAVAQGVQVSAFPDRYAGKMPRGRELAESSGVFDAGGLAYGTGNMRKDVIAPERVLDPQQTRAFDNLVFNELPKQRDGEGPGVTVIVNLDGQQVLEKRIEAVEGKAEINEQELRAIKTLRRAIDAGVTLLA